MFACVWLVATPRLDAAPPISTDSVWAAPDGVVQELQIRCGAVQVERATCYRAVATRYGALPAAVEAIELLRGEGHITGFRAAGRVDLAVALFPFRANQNTALLVVNGDPPVVDADDPAFLARGWEPSRMGGVPEPPASLFPGDRFPLEALAIETAPDAGQRLTLPYALRACRACPALTTVWYSLALDAAGRFLGFSFARAANEEAALGVDRTTAQVASGAVVLIRLPANRTTGYLWMLGPLLSDGALRLLWHAYRVSAPTRPGAPGEDLWWLEALQPGMAAVTLRHLRPWEPDPNAPTRQFVIEVTAR